MTPARGFHRGDSLSFRPLVLRLLAADPAGDYVGAMPRRCHVGHCATQFHIASRRRAWLPRDAEVVRRNSFGHATEEPVRPILLDVYATPIPNKAFTNFA